MAEVRLERRPAAPKKEKVCRKCKLPGKTFYNDAAVDCTDCIALASKAKWAEKKKDKALYGLI